MTALELTAEQELDLIAAPKVHPGLIVDRWQGHAILLHPRQPMWAVTNAGGERLAALLDGTRTLGAVVEQLAAQYPATDRAVIARDVLAFAGQLRAANLLENMPLPREAYPARPVKLPDFSIYVTEDCNLRCKHCYVVEGKMPKPTLSTADVLRLLDEQTALKGESTIGITGGEPLLRHDILEILRHACTKSRYVTLTTNGLLVDEPMARELAALPMRIQVSLDGPDPEVHDFIRGKGSFDKAWAGVERLAAAGARDLMISTTLTRTVLSQVRAMVDRCDAMPALKVLRFVPLNKMKAALTHWDRIAPQPEEMVAVLRYLLLQLPSEPRHGKTAVRAGLPGFVPDVDPRGDDHWCPLGKMALVDSQGNVWNCPTLRGPEWKIGNVHLQSLTESQQGTQNRQGRDQMMARRHQVEECQRCSWRNFCQGGCQAYMSLQSGSLYVNDSYCEFRRELYREHAIREAHAAARGEKP